MSYAPPTSAFGRRRAHPRYVWLLTLSLGCQNQEGTTASGVLVRVNGVAITQADLDRELRSAPRSADKGAEAQGALQAIVHREMKRQKAKSLGLKLSTENQERLQALEAQARDFEREALAETYEKTELEKRARVTDEDGRKYFEANAEGFQTKVRILQILRRSRGDIEAVKAALDAGRSFESVAQEGLPVLPEGSDKPWDVGTLSLRQVPESWLQAAKTLNPGQISDVIEGPKSRFWIIQLVDRHVDSGVTYDLVREGILAQLRQERLFQVRETLHEELEKSAKIEWVKQP